MSIRNNFVQVHAAAEILGVAPNTVRKWGAAGKIPEYRHPANGYRLYKREELEAFLRQIKLSIRIPIKPKS
jgi:excisionase family DNA binding protein